jgi:hypothetical protein
MVMGFDVQKVNYLRQSWVSSAIAVAVSGVAPNSIADAEIADFARTDLAAVLEAIHAPRETISFEKNVGQFNEAIRFYANSHNHELWVLSDGIALQPRFGAQSPPPIRLRFGDLTAFTSVEGVSEVKTKSNYLLKTGNRTSETFAAPHFNRVVAKGVMFGVDAHIYTRNGEFEYDLVSSSGQMPRSILIRVEGAVKLELNNAGDVVIHDTSGTFIHRAPRVFESDIDGQREVRAYYRLIGMDDIELVIERQNELAQITVDPVLAYSGHVGGSGQFEVADVASDFSGNTFVAGNRYRNSIENPSIAKIDASGSLVFTVEIAANAGTKVKKIATDKSGNFVLVGETCATNFPTVNAVYANRLGSNCDGFVARFDGQSGAAIFSTYLGTADGGDSVADVAIDEQDRIHVAGVTGSRSFPSIATSFASANLPSLFYARFSPAGAIEAAGTPGIGMVGSSPKIALDRNGYAVIAGTMEASGSFPEINFEPINPISIAPRGFVAAIDVATNNIAYSTRIGGSGGATNVTDVAADDYGSVYLLGNTQAGQSFLQGRTQSVSGFFGSNNFLVRVDSNRQPPILGRSFISPPSPSSAAIGYSRFLPFSGTPYALAINKGSRELSATLGFALPKSVFYEVPLNGVAPAANTIRESFVLHAAPDGQILYGTKLGGSGSADYPTSLALDASGAYIVGGYSDSFFSNAFPVVSAGYVGPRVIGGRSATLSKISAPIFKPQFDVRPGVERVSNSAMIVSANNPISLSISPGSEYSVGCNGAFTATPTSVASGSTVCVRHTSSQVYSGITASVLKINSVDEPFFTVSAGADDFDGDGVPDAVEFAEGLDWRSRDNALFAGSAPDSDRLFAMQQYRDFLGREAEPAGLKGWTNLLASKTLTREQVARSFFDSQEFQVGVPPVVRLYLGYFKRIPDHAGLWGWVSALRSGTPLREISSAFSASAEFQATYGNLNNIQFVTQLYRNILNRAPETAGLDYWTNQLNSGVSRGEVMLGFSESAEFQSSTGTAVLVIMTYEGLLRRAAEPEGFADWLRYLEAGNDSLALTRGFIYSQEYRNRFLKQ